MHKKVRGNAAFSLMLLKTLILTYRTIGIFTSDVNSSYNSSLIEIHYRHSTTAACVLLIQLSTVAHCSIRPATVLYRKGLENVS